MADLTFYHYPNCSTCKKALNWLMEHSVRVKLIDITEQPPTQSELKRALSAVDGKVQKLFNVSGQLYREGNYKERLLTMTEKEALTELSKHGKLIKRPLLLGKDLALVGFKSEAYHAAFSA